MATKNYISIPFRFNQSEDNRDLSDFYFHWIYHFINKNNDIPNSTLNLYEKTAIINGLVNFDEINGWIIPFIKYNNPTYLPLTLIDHPLRVIEDFLKDFFNNNINIERNNNGIKINGINSVNFTSYYQDLYFNSLNDIPDAYNQDFVINGNYKHYNVSIIFNNVLNNYSPFLIIN
jgi:hypothetical protein